MPAVHVTEFTDPACPFAYSAEPVRRRLEWRYGAHLAWTVRLVGLARDRAAQEAKGFDAERNASILRNFDEHGMPLTRAERREPAGTWDACRLVLAARAAGGEEAALRTLRGLRVAGLAEARPIDHPDVLSDVCELAGLDPVATTAAARDDAVGAAFASDLDAARTPGRIALALDHKLADVEDGWSGAAGPAGRRYTCPSFVFAVVGGPVDDATPDGPVGVPAPDDADLGVAEAPGFQPWASVEAVLANVAPELVPRPWAEDAAEVVRWAPFPLATQEVAAVLDLDDREEARARLRAAGAFEHEVGTDAFWTAG